MSEHVIKSHNKTLLLYHLVFPAKYRRKIFSEAVETTLKEICIGISERYEIRFIEIGTDKDHVHFLVQGVPSQALTKIVMGIKSITARELYKVHPEIKKQLWGGNIWTSGYYANTVGQYGNEKTIKEYVQKQGNDYKQIYRSQLDLFTV
jgi:REP element-mobilizing transposase RayT